MSSSTINPTRSEMQVVSCAGGGVTRLDRRPLPEPATGELRLRLRCCGLCGTDLFKLTNDTAAPGTVLGHELVGVVDAVGDGVDDFAVGERVVVPHHVACGHCSLCRRGSETLCAVFRETLLEPGGFSEYVLVRERAVRLAARKLPDSLRDESAVFLEPAACVMRSIRNAHLSASLLEDAAGRAEVCVVILGAGSMGLLHLLVLRALYPGISVVVCDARQDRLESARTFGAGHVTLPGADLEAAVRAASRGLGADAVFDTVGGARLLDSALGLARSGGTAVLFAHAPAAENAGFELNELFKEERRVVGTYSGGLDDQREIFELLVSGGLDPTPLVTHRLPLSDFGRALELARSYTALKILLEPES
jgi:L-iditol 2-dehydrogenase